MPMNVEVLTGLPGCGKSYEMRREARANPGLYLFVYPSIPLIREQSAAFAAETEIDVVEAHSQAAGSGSVQNRLERHKAHFEANGIDHAVVLMTHEGLMGADLSAFTDWNIRIDEAPNTIQSGVVKVPASADMLKSEIQISPVGSDGWGELHLLGGKRSWSALANDNLLKPLAEMIKQASRQHGVFVDTLDWKDQFGWCSIWPLKTLAHCKSVKIAGASYPVSLGAIVAERWEQVQFTPRLTVRPRTHQPHVRVHYFTQSHEGSTRFWGTSRGRLFITKICDFLRKNEPKLGFWAANKVVVPLLDHRLNRKAISPKAAGLNEFDQETSCALIYSSKALPEDKPVKALFGITDKEILRAREEEDILQFVMRGAIRRRDFGGTYDIYLYSKRQADLVAEKLKASDIGKAVDLVPEPDAGIMDEEPEPAKAVRNALRTKRKAETNADYKERERVRKQNDRAAKAVAEGREPGQIGRAKGRKDKAPRKARTK